MTDELPYVTGDGEATAGWSGSETSHERARQEAGDGSATRRQQHYLMLIERAGHAGVTWRELSTTTGEHHGQVSGALSVLHKTGRVARLRQKRNRCQIYVSPRYVLDRPTSPYKANKPGAIAFQPHVLTSDESAAVERLREKEGNGFQVICLEAEQVRALLRFITRATGVPR